MSATVAAGRPSRRFERHCGFWPLPERSRFYGENNAEEDSQGEQEKLCVESGLSALEIDRLRGCYIACDEHIQASYGNRV